MAASLPSFGQETPALAEAGTLPSAPASVDAPMLSPPPPPPPPPLARGRARPARVALRRLSADVAQSLTTISQRGIDCLIAMNGAHTGPIGVIAHDKDTRAPRAGHATGRGETPAGWRLSLSAGVSQTLREQFDREALIDWSGARMRLLYRNAAALSWLAARLNIDGGTPLDDASARSLRSAALDDLMARLALTGLGAPHVVHDQTIATGHRDAGSSVFSFVVLLQPLNDARTTILAALETDAFGVNLLAALLENRRERPPAAARDPASIAIPGADETDGADAVADDAMRASRHRFLSMRTRLVLPPVSLPIVDVRALSAGDIVLLGVPSLSSAHGTQAASHVSEGMHAIRGGDREDIALSGFVAIDDVSCWRMVVAPSRDKGAAAWRVRLINQEFGVADEAMDDFNGSANRSRHGEASAGQGGRSARDDGADIGDAWTDRVPVRVTFELGAKTVSLAELQRWREGSILTFPVPLSFRAPHRAPEPSPVDAGPSAGAAYLAPGADTLGERGAEDAAADVAYDEAQDEAPYDGQTTEDATEPDDLPAVLVRIRVNGAPLGVGELVDIDGQLGVSVLRLFVAGAGDGRDIDDNDASDAIDRAVTEARQ
ncbi:hypothetical protein [Robbsia sp. KACC 23696]|uniref:hypothetical protein n=1 Tax=Robbsia sp. KACC 23696 TaxID=3149231 RepID=UPI00325B4E64